MKKFRFLIALLVASSAAMAQDLPYADASNPHYWKNRKPYAGYWQQDVAYKIRARLNDSADLVTASEELIYTNNSPDTLHFVYFHLYQNAFVKGSYLEQLNKANNFYQRFGKHEAAGNGTRLSKVQVTVNGKTYHQTLADPDAVQWGDAGVQKAMKARLESVVVMDEASVANYPGEDVVRFDNSIMYLKLPAPLLPGQQAVFNLDFRTYFDIGGNQRRRMKIFTDDWGNKQYDGVHWYPRICVYDRKFGWETDQHLGKEFYGDFGSYDVELTLPNHYVLDATGVLQNREEVLPADLRSKLDIANFKDKPLNSPPSQIVKPDGSYKTWKFKSINTHDFAWVADPTFRIGESILTLANGSKVSCIALAQEPHAAKWQDASSFTAKVIEVYSRDIGTYAYPKMIVADARDGMEYPMLTLDGGLSPGYYSLLAHEVGHNWFFGMVGNNETYRASLDEGFTQFLTNWSMTSIFGEVKPTPKNPYPVTRRDQTVYLGYIRDAMKHDDMPLNTHSDDFNGALNHGGGYGHVYYKTATMLYNLQYVLGDQLFLAAMQHYFDQWKMAHPYFEDFRASIINFTHADLNWFFDQWLETTKTIDYSIDQVKRGDRFEVEMKPGSKQKTVLSQNYTVKLRRKGEMQMPIDLVVYGKDSGQVFKYYIPNTYFNKQLDSGTLAFTPWKGWGNLNRTYEAQFSLPPNVQIRNVVIDPSNRLADVYQLDNRLNGNTLFLFDRGRTRPQDRMHYIYEWRPDVWYNSIDKLKVGLHLEGHYMYALDMVNASVWYNTGRLSDKGAPNRSTVDYNLVMRTMPFRNYSSYFMIRQLDGLFASQFGVMYTAENKVTYNIYWKSMLRRTNGEDYLLYPGDWTTGKVNGTLNIDLSRTFNYRNGSLEVKEGIRGSFFSNYSYSGVHITVINKNQMGRLELRTRLKAQTLFGDLIAPESRLYLSGANPEELMDNKYTRSSGFVPNAWVGNYGLDYNHFQAGGGLNVRGYAGYLVPRSLSSGPQVYLNKGDAGVGLNAELDLDGLVKFTPHRIANVFHLDAYVFGDAGILSNRFKSGEFGLTSEESVSTGLMSSAGLGFALNIKKWLSFDKARPLVIRADFPLFLSNSPFIDGQYLRFRWMLGINRSF